MVQTGSLHHSNLEGSVASLAGGVDLDEVRLLLAVKELKGRRNLDRTQLGQTESTALFLRCTHERQTERTLQSRGGAEDP